MAHTNFWIHPITPVQVLCAYDPNDISVNPIGTLYRMNPGQTFELTYTIRFQNIGNDTAFDVSLFLTSSLQTWTENTIYCCQSPM